MPTSYEGLPALSQQILRRVLADDREVSQLMGAPLQEGGVTDLLFATPGQVCRPETVFEQLRWGGLLVYASPLGRPTADLARAFASHGFALERGPAVVREGWWGLPLLSRKTHFFVARKVQLVPPGEASERFTYNVQLERSGGASGPLVVVKRVPTLDAVIDRLRRRWSEVALDVIEKRARKFTDKIFPTFLTREAAFLQILQENLPDAHARRVPRALSVEKDDRGMVRLLRMNWLRNGVRPVDQMEFALQSADLLRGVHDVARVIHLDLRLDNFVITNAGVGFVDFGSAVRDGEDVNQNPLLSTLFGELMRTSQIQQMLEKMTLTGAVTSHAIRAGHRKIDKAVDLFYLALQFNSPHANPDLAGLIHHDPESDTAQALAQLTRQVLRPREPSRPTFRTAQDILRALEDIQRGATAVA